MILTKQEYARVFGAMKLPLMLGVVLIHCRYNLSDFPMLFQNEYLIADKVIKFISGCLALVCVPLFFVISGFFFFYGVERFTASVFIGKLHRRVKTLLIPYFLWNLIGFAVLLLKKTEFFSGLATPPDATAGVLEIFIHSFWSLSTVLPDAGNYPADFPFWFIRNLIIITIFTPPVLFLIVKRLKWIMIILLLIVEYFYNTYGLLYFAIGASVALLDMEKFSAFVARYGWIFLIAYLLLAYFMTVSNYEKFYDMSLPMIISGIIGLLWVGARMNIADNKLIAKWQNASFFIFAFHGLFCSMLRKSWLRLVAPQSSFALLVCYVLSFCSMIVICVLVMKVMQKLSPRLLGILTGSRA